MATLAACSSSASIDGAVEWSVPHELTANEYGLTQAFSVAEVPGYVTVTGYEDETVVVRTFDTNSGDEIEQREVSGAVACTAMVEKVLCTPVDWTSGQVPFLIDPESGESHDYALTIMALGEFDGRDVIQRSTPTGYELVTTEPSLAIDDYARGGDVIAVIDMAGERHLLDEATYESLIDTGVLPLGSAWRDVSAIPGAQAIADGFITVSSNAQSSETVVSLFEASGTQVDTWSVEASLHFSTNPEWTSAEVRGYFDEAVQLSQHFDHIAIFSDGEVVGLNQLLTDSVAPAFSWVKGFDTSLVTTLEFLEVADHTLVLWVVDYPYISIAGRGDEIAAVTYNVETGEKLVDGAKCQWTDSAYCFDGETLKKVSF